MEPQTTCQELPEHDRVTKREQAQSNRETTADHQPEMQIALTVKTKAREQKEYTDLKGLS